MKLRLGAIVLAAGEAKRFGGNKLSSTWGEGMLVDGALAAAAAAPVETIVVVTGADALAKQRIAAHPDPRMRAVYNPGYETGMAGSLKMGVSALPKGLHGAFILLGDMPRIPHDIFEPLVQALLNGAPAAAPSFGGERGHPVLLAAGILDELMQLEGDTGAGAILRLLGPQLKLIPTGDDGVLFDVDIRGG